MNSISLSYVVFFFLFFFFSVHCLVMLGRAFLFVCENTIHVYGFFFLLSFVFSAIILPAVLRLQPMLEQLKEGLQLYDLLSLIKQYPDICQPLFAAVGDVKVSKTRVTSYYDEQETFTCYEISSLNGDIIYILILIGECRVCHGIHCSSAE